MPLKRRSAPEWSWLIAIALGLMVLNRMVAARGNAPNCSLGVCPVSAGGTAQ
jgi:hypothetical protein